MDEQKLKALRTRLVVMNLEGATYEEWCKMKKMIDGLYNKRNKQSKLTRQKVDLVRDIYEGLS